MENNIVSGQISQFQRTHGMVQTKLDRLVHFFRLITVHDAPEGLIHKRIHQPGNNETGMLLDDTITVSDSANGTSTDLTISVLYGKILNVFPKTLFGSRWLYLPKIMFIIGEDTAFNGSTYPTFTPGDSIIKIGQIGIGNLMSALVLLIPNPEEGVLDLAVTTVNGAGQTVVFPLEDALTIKLLPLMLDEKGK